MILKTKKNNLFEVFAILKDGRLVQSSLIEQVFFAQGIPIQDVAIFSQKGTHRVSAYISRKRQAERILASLRCLKLKKVSFRLKVIPKQNWQKKWEKSFSAFRLTKQFDVVPTWRKYHATHRKPIFLSSINAFGTGLHETTNFMAQLVERCQNCFESFLDIGTGTGLLAIIAKRCGAKEIYAVDIDKQCVKSAKENLKINGLSPSGVHLADISHVKNNQKYGFVAANLITHDLIRLKRKILSFVAPRGFLAISGISLDNLPRIKTNFQVLPVRCVKIITGKQWAALLYRRNS
ncbi:MAG: 50S ribosomal protein L11 methyltransferase [Candidatus Aceula meridiana]|nr:50S ribosomal protein L11 methyltransferase [Candidatus Aceula meridiana]